ncbi:STAS domain-containing protein [Gammaproteobacteria bacterium]|nr:STAS domain-containing protein [Gammaproteobacteria bacterium]
MKSKLSAESNYDVLELSGEIDLHYSPQLREMILGSLKNGNSLLINMAEVSYIDSSGIASLVEGFQTAKTANLSYGLLTISSPALQVLTLTRLDRVFTLYDTVEQFQSQL